MPKKKNAAAYRLAHFGDLHLEAEDEEFDWVLHMVDHALERGADHCVFTGDIVDEGQVDVVGALLRALRQRGLGSDEVSIVPGNHDVYPVSWSFSAGAEKGAVAKAKAWLGDFITGLPSAGETILGAGKNNIKRLSRMISSFNGKDAKLFSDIVFPYGKRLHADVVLAGFDTTRSESWKPHDWATGELPDEHVEEVKTFFDQNKDAKHRVVLMHHYPFDDFKAPYPRLMPMKFVEPNAATVRNWLADAGATLVLCGHIHGDRKLKRAREGFDVMTTDSSYYELVSGGSGRAYTLLTLGGSGRAMAEQVCVEEE